MKKLLCACLPVCILAAPMALAENTVMTGTATISRQCAPNDGAAYQIKVSFADGSKFEIRAWGAGLEKLQSGKPVTLNENSTINSMASGVSCTAGDKCAMVPSTAQIPPEAFTSDNPVKGIITIEGSTIPVTIEQMKNAPQQLCG